MDQVQLVEDGRLVILDDRHEVQATRVARDALQQPRDRMQQQQNSSRITRLDARTHDLDDDVFAAAQSRGVDLRDRRRSERLFVERGEYVDQRLAEARFDLARASVPGERRHPILQFRELFRVVRRQQIAPRRQDLAEFDEHRTQRFECEPQPARGRICRRRQPSA